MLMPTLFAAFVTLSPISGSVSLSEKDKTEALAQITAAGQQDAYYIMCFKTGERISGMNRICYYQCGASEAVITVKSTELCPLSIDR